MAPVTLTEVTDPFCTWCWGIEPMLRRVEEIYRDQVEFDFVMGGLVEDFEEFYDPAYDIHEPHQVAPHWEEAADRHGMPVDAGVWRDDPPHSTYPANMAYKAAELQSTELAHRYLRRLREAVATERRNIARTTVLLELAEEVGLDADALTKALESGTAKAAFEEDRRFVRRNNVTAFPSVQIATEDDERWLSGYQPFDAFDEALSQVAPDLERHKPRSIPEFVRHHGQVATQEIAEVYGLEPGKALQALQSLEDAGVLTAVQRGTSYFWRPASLDLGPDHLHQTDSQTTSDGSSDGNGDLGDHSCGDGQCRIDPS